MSIHHKIRLAIPCLSLAGLVGCESVGNTMAPLSSQQADNVWEECGLIPPTSRMKNSANPRRRAYHDCKRNVLGEEADHEPLT